MNGCMFRPSESHQILEPIIQRVVVEVVNHRAARAWTVCRFPHDHGTLTPDIRLGHLHECSSITVALVAGANSDRPHREVVAGPCAGDKLRSDAATFAFRNRPQRHVCRCRAGHRAVVDLAHLRWLSVERQPADWTLATDGGSSAGGRTVVDRRALPDVRLRPIEDPFAGGTGEFHARTLSPFAGTGTTLAVANLHGRNAIGIDVDARNRDLLPARMAEVKRNLFGAPIPKANQLELTL